MGSWLSSACAFGLDLGDDLSNEDAPEETLTRAAGIEEAGV
jgi:hypothetical protein